MKYDKMSRRLFLQGAGGLLLAIPTMSSLITKSYAQDQQNLFAKRFFSISFPNDGRPSWWFPFDYKSLDGVAGSGFRFKSLSALRLGTKIWSPGFDKHKGNLTLIRGIDGGHLGHGTSSYLGFYSNTHGSGEWVKTQAGFNFLPVEDRPSGTETIDTLMARHRGLNPREKILTLGSMSSTVVNHGGQFQFLQAPNNSNPFEIFKAYFTSNAFSTSNLSGGSSGSSGSSGSKLVDRVKTDLRNIMGSASISQLERANLDEHMTFVSELEGRYANTPQPQQPPQRPVTRSCNSAVNNPYSQIPGSWLKDAQSHQVADLHRYYSDLVTIMSEAIKCNLFSFGSLGITEALMTSSSDQVQAFANQSQPVTGSAWHLGAAHGQANELNDRGEDALLIDPKNDDAETQTKKRNAMFQNPRMSNIQNWIMNSIFLPLLDNLSVEEPNTQGRTYLENSMILLAPEYGGTNHSNHDWPMVVAGKAQTAINAGNYLDFTKRNPGDPNVLTNANLAGIPQGRFLISLLQAAGLKPSDYAKTATGIGRFTGNDWKGNPGGWNNPKYLGFSSYRGQSRICEYVSANETSYFKDYHLPIPGFLKRAG